MFVADGRLPDEEHTLTIRPQPRSAMAGRRGAHQSHGRHHVELPLGLPLVVGQLVRASGPRSSPAPLTSASTRPNRSRHASSTRAPASGRGDVERHRLTGAAGVGARPRQPRPEPRRAGRPGPRAAPSRASATAVAFPTPPDAPVTMQARSRRPRSMLDHSSMAPTSENGERDHPHRRPDQGLSGHRLQGGRRASTCSVRAGEIFGLLGPERRRQDDDGGDAHDAGHPDRRAARSSGPSTSSPTRRWPSS